MTDRITHSGKGKNATWRMRLLALPLAAAACAMALVPGSASASTPSATVGQSAAANPCAGRSQTYIVANYKRGSAVYPLRCGTSTWGYVHLIQKHEYLPGTIAVVVARGGQSTSGHFFYKGYPGSAFGLGCKEVSYRVVYNTGALNGNGVRPQGIITAYPICLAQPL